MLIFSKITHPIDLLSHQSNSALQIDTIEASSSGIWRSAWKMEIFSDFFSFSANFSTNIEKMTEKSDFPLFSPTSRCLLRWGPSSDGSGSRRRRWRVGRLLGHFQSSVEDTTLVDFVLGAELVPNLGFCQNNDGNRWFWVVFQEFQMKTDKNHVFHGFSSENL